MKQILVALLSATMIGYTILRAITTMIFMPLAVGTSSNGVYFVSLVLTAAGITALSFTLYDRIAGFLALAISFAAITYWWIIICGASRPIWSDFGWFVIPEVCFGFAGIGKWLVKCRLVKNDDLGSTHFSIG